MRSNCSLNAFFDRETDADWDKELAEDVKGECESKYGPVDRIKVEKETQVKLTVYLCDA
jgi:RNA-binding protein 23/39